MESFRETVKVVNAVVNYGGRVYFYYVVFILQRGFYINLEIVYFRASFFSVRNFLEYGKSAVLFKDQVKEGAVYRLLNVSGSAGAASGGSGFTRAFGIREIRFRCLRGLFVGFRRCFICQSFVLLVVGGRWLLSILFRGLFEELKEMRV